MIVFEVRYAEYDLAGTPPYQFAYTRVRQLSLPWPAQLAPEEKFHAEPPGLQ